MRPADRPMSATVAAALDYAARGWRVFPCQPAIIGVKESGKRPITAHGVKDAVADATQIGRWWDDTPTANIGVACGPRLVVVDIDTATPCAPFDVLPDTMIVRTGRGLHVYLDAAGETFPNRAGVSPGVDVRSENGYVIAPPSVHYSGSVYEWDGSLALAPIPAEWLPFMRARKADVPAPALPLDIGQGSGDVLKRAQAYLRAIPGAVSGQRGHADTFMAAQSMVLGFGLSESDAFALMMNDYNGRCDPPWSAREIQHKVSSAAATGSMPYGSLRDAERERPSNVVPMRGASRPAGGESPRVVRPLVPTPMVASLLEANTRAAAHWRGRGKGNGDCSARGYDVTVARDVFAAGGTDGDARSAVLSRPDGHAATRDDAYLDDVLRCALAAVVPTGKDRAAAFAADKVTEALGLVESVTLYRTDPPTYELSIGGVKFDTTAGVLVNRARMITRIIEATNTMPPLPQKHYDDWVRALLARAVVVEMPDDASEAGGVIAEISYMLEGMAIGEDNDALERGLLVVDEQGRQCLSLRAFARRVAASLPKVTRPTLCKMLRTLGWSDVQLRIGDDARQIRAWRKPCDET